MSNAEGHPGCNGTHLPACGISGVPLNYICNFSYHCADEIQPQEEGFGGSQRSTVYPGSQGPEAARATRSTMLSGK